MFSSQNPEPSKPRRRPRPPWPDHDAKPPVEPGPFAPRVLVRDRDWLPEVGNPSKMTVNRWEKDESLRFPKVVVIRRRKHRFRDEIELFKAHLVAMTESGESVTINPREEVAKRQV